MPTVSVIVPTRNRPDYLQQALMSIASQTFDDFEVIVVDDGSDDLVFKQYEQIWAALDHRFVLADPRKPGAPGTGPADTRNRGIEQARGEFLAFLDDDDEWIAPDHLEVGVNTLRKFDGEFYFGNMQGYRAGKVTIPDWFHYAPYLLKNKKLDWPHSIYEVSRRHVARALQRNSIHLNIVIIRKDLVQKFGGFLKHSWWGEDVNFALHAADCSRKIFYRSDVVARSRFAIADNSVSMGQTSQSRLLQQVLSLQEIRVNCKTRTVRKAARKIEAWVYRRLAQENIENRHGREAFALARQSLCTSPSLAGVVSVVSALSNTIWSRNR